MTAKFIHIALVMALPWMIPPASQAQTPFQRLTKKFESGQIFQAHFTHETVDSYTGNKSKRTGEIWVGKTEYKVKSDAQEVAVNGKISRVYDHNRHRVIISKYNPEDDDFAPSRFLNGVDSTYIIKSQQKKGNHYIIKLRSDDPFAMFKKVNITLSLSDIPEKLYVVDTADNQITTTFSKGKFIRRQPGMFTISYPDSVKVIDMRNNRND